MKSPEQIVAYIDTHIHYAITRRPWMYASTPEALEEVLSALDTVRYFILFAPEAEFPVHEPSYSTYLSRNGYGVAGFCTRYRERSERAVENRELFAELAAFWRRYVADRMSASSGSQP